MEKKNFDMSLVHRVNLIVKEHSDQSYFEWFVIGFLYAHPNNAQTLEKLFTDVHSVMNLTKTNHLLTFDDTYDILIKMINNLLRSQVNYSQ